MPPTCQLPLITLLFFLSLLSYSALTRLPSLPQEDGTAGRDAEKRGKINRCRHLARLLLEVALRTSGQQTDRPPT